MKKSIRRIACAMLPIAGFVACGPLTEDEIGVEEDTAVGLEDTESKADQLTLESGALVGLAGKCLNVEGAWTANGTRVILWDCVGARNEEWRLVGARIVGLAGRCLTANGRTRGSGVSISACNGGTLQQWGRSANTQIYSRGSGLCMTPRGRSSASGTPIVLEKCSRKTLDDKPANDANAASDADAQKWFYEPKLTLQIEAVAVSDSDGKRPPSITPTQFGDAVDQMNQIYRAAHIRFVFDRNRPFSQVYDTGVNNIACAAGDSPEAGARGHQIGYRFPRRVVVLLRQAGNGGSCTAPPWSGPGNVIFFRNFNNAGNGGVLAHEMGHYLGLDHTFIEESWLPNPPAGVVIPGVNDLPGRLRTYLSGGGSLDADRLSDTPGDPGTSVWQALGMTACGGGTANVAGVAISPSGTNVMSYYGCAPASFSRKQRLRMRRALAHALRRHLTAGPQRATAPREIFGMNGYCLARDPFGTRAVLKECGAGMRFTFGLRGEIRLGNRCLVASSETGIWARPFFRSCMTRPDERWTRTAEGRLVSWNGRSLAADSGDGRVFQDLGTLGPDMIWGSYYPR